jgi:hypothetical protein
MSRIALILLLLLGEAAHSQNFMRPNEWKKYRREIFLTLGTANFLGDLGGRQGNGSHYSPADLNFTQTRTAFGVGARYKLAKEINIAGKFNYLIVKGDDVATENQFRKNRNLNFRSNIFELTVRGEMGYSTKKQGASRYGLRQTFGNVKNITHSIYGFGGIGLFYFNPQGKLPSGKWINLYPLHTEGQGLPGGPAQYKRIAVCIPFGAFYKLTVNKVWSVGIEFCFRKTFTDYIDDVGSAYYDQDALEAAYGPVSRQMADPNIGLIPGGTHPAGDGTPAKRGDSQKDSYFSVELSASYIFKKQRKSARLRSKF